jgi:hypothetical protein
MADENYRRTISDIFSAGVIGYSRLVENDDRLKTKVTQAD